MGPWWKNHRFSTADWLEFAVQRDVADNDQWGTIWVSVSYADESQIDRAVQWGTWDSLVGVAGPFLAGGLSAHLTVTPWKFKHNDPEL